MSTSVSCFWPKKEIDVLMVDEIKCCGIKNVKLVGCNMNPTHVKVLVVNGNLLGFDLLCELNAINELSDMQITELSNVYFLKDVQPLISISQILAQNLTKAKRLHHESGWMGHCQRDYKTVVKISQILAGQGGV